MNDLSFDWAGPQTLVSELQKPIIRVSLSMYAGRPNILSFWRMNGTCLQVYSQMQDIGDRLEVSILKFDLSEGEPDYSIVLDFVREPITQLTFYKLTNIECSVRYDAGIEAESAGNLLFRVAGGSFPCTLALQGLFKTEHVDEPEYPWNIYSRSKL